MLGRTDSELTGNTWTDGRSHRSRGEHDGTKRALLVDDHDLFRQCLAMMLEQHTDLDESLQAGSLADARRVLAGREGKELALAVVDLDLLADEGDELIKDLRRIETPVLVINARQDSEPPAQESVAAEVLTTGSSDDLLRAVRRLVGC